MNKIAKKVVANSFDVKFNNKGEFRPVFYMEVKPCNKVSISNCLIKKI